MANYKDGIISEGFQIGSGTALGNISDGIIREARNYSSIGTGTCVGNVKDGIIYKGNYSSQGYGDNLGNVKDGIIYKGSWSSPGHGDNIGRVSDFKIEGMEREPEAIMVAAYHFLVKNIF